MRQSENQPAALVDEWLTPGRFLALLALCLFAAFPEVFLGSHTFYYRDFGHFAYPLAHYHRECFWRGEIPLWNPYSSCGIPHLAQWNTMCLYPGALLYLLGPMPWALGLFSLVHLLVAGAGAYHLAHRWAGNRFAAGLGGLAFAFNGFTLHAVMWPNNVAALSWAPWFWLLTERACREGGRTIVLAALVGAMQMLAGAPEVILFTWAISALLALGKVFSGRSESIASVERSCATTEHRILNTDYFPLLRLAAIAGLTFILSAAQLLPFLDLLRHSHRSVAFDDGLYALPWSGWANFFVPLFRMTPDRNGVFTQLDQQWTSSYYPGLSVLALAALAVWRGREPRVRLLAVVAVFGVWLAMGQEAFLLAWLKAVCPPLGFIRFPIKYVLLPLMVLPFLAAFGLAHLRQPASPTVQSARRSNDEPCLPWLQPLMVVALGLLAVCGAILCWASLEKSAATWPTVSSQAFVALMLLALLTVLLIRALKSAPLARLKPEWVILGLFAADILLHAPRQNPTVITQAYEPSVANLPATLPRLGEGRALITREMEVFMAHASNPDALNYCIGARRALFANWNLLEDVPKANGFLSLFPHELSETWRLLYGFGQPFPERFADFLGVTHASSSDALFTWAHRANALPLVTAGQQPIFTNPTNTLRALASPDFNPAQVVYLPETLRPLSTVTNAASARVLSTRWGAGAVRIEVETDAPAWVVIAQTHFHPWTAFVGERCVPIHRANHAFQALEVPAGCHSVELRYVDPAFQLGGAVSFASLLCAGLWWRFGRTAT